MARGWVASLLPRRSDYAGIGRSWRGDVLAGLTVGVVALPLALAFGMTTGLGAAAGVTTAIVAGAIAAIFGGSHVQVSGPTGAMTVVLVPLVQTHGPEAVVGVGVLAGLLVVAAGLLRLGRAIAYLPWPVIEGFTLGIATIIFLQQVPAALGVESSDGDNPAAVAALAARDALGDGSAHALALVAVVVAVMLLAARVHRGLPASLLAVGVATLLAGAAGWNVTTIGTLPSALPALQPFDVSLSDVSVYLGPAFAVALLAGIESLLSAKVADGMTDLEPHDPDRELVGQGLANIAAPLLGGMPATGAIARTAVNVRAGARTRLAAISHSVVLVAVVVVGARLVSRIPIAALAAVLMVTAARMVERRNLRSVARATRSDAVVLALTAVATVAFDLIVAVELGVAIAALLALRHVARTSAIVPIPVPDDLARPTSTGEPGVVAYGIGGVLFFGAAQRFVAQLSATPRGSVVVFRLPDLRVLDATGAQAFGQIVSSLTARGATVLVKGARPEHLRTLTAVGALDTVPPEHRFADMAVALAHAGAHADASDDVVCCAGRPREPAGRPPDPASPCAR